MASPLQQQSLRRKITYFVLIIAFFTAALVMRQAGSYSMEAVANRLEIREQNLGDVDLFGSAMKLMLTGARGLVVCFLWNDAQDKKKKHEWNELDQRIHLLAKLQPHFITPWLFQSWNLAYNVSVEFDRVKDKYYYVARGINLLAEGERQNRDNPEMRFFIGNYTQSKIGISDENHTMRAFFRMSCMNPAERNPRRFRHENGDIDYVQFLEFCQRQPFFVRDLYDHLRCKTPEDVIDFLAANRQIPSRYEDPSDTTDWTKAPLVFKQPETERFPVLPPSDAALPGEKLSNDEVEVSFDNYLTSRAWYSYALVPVDSGKYQKPLKMARILFQGYPARAQSYFAERLEQDGWFDRDGWAIKDWFPENEDQPTGPKRIEVVGTTQDWALNAWRETFRRYAAHSEKNGLYAERRLDEVTGLSDMDMQEMLYKRRLSNIDHFYVRAMVDQTEAAVAARKAFFEANQQRRLAESRQAVRVYETPAAFNTPANWANAYATGWKKILLDNPRFRQDVDQQEETYITQFKYKKVFVESRAPMFRQLAAVTGMIGQQATLPTPAKLWPPLVNELQSVPPPFQPERDGTQFKGPLDDVDNEGQPFFSPEAISRAQGRIPDFMLKARAAATETPKPAAPERGN